jgi:D-galactonate transporter
MRTASERLAAAGSSSLCRSQLYRKITMHLMPFVFLTYVVNQIDRTNVSFAKLQFVTDLGLSEAAYGVGAGMFFIGYVLFEVPSNLILHRIGARKTLVRIMVFWGLMSMSMCLVTTSTQLYIVRFLLGVAEAGFFPGMIYYLGLWYPSQQRARITSLLVMGIPVAGIVSSPLSGLIMQSFDGAVGLRGWQWMFLIEGIPAVLLGFATPWFLVDRPGEAPWLAEAEKIVVEADLHDDAAQRLQKPSHHMHEAILDPKTYVAGAIYFAVLSGTNALVLWMPTIITEAGRHSLSLATIGLLACIPWISAVVGMRVFGLSSDRTMERRWHLAASMLITAIGFLLLPHFAGHLSVVILILALSAVGIYSALTIFWTIPATFLAGSAAAGGIALISSIGAFGGFVSPSIIGWAKTATGSADYGLAAIAAVLCLAILLLIVGFSEAVASHADSPE